MIALALLAAQPKQEIGGGLVFDAFRNDEAAGLAWNDGFRPSDGVALTSAGGGVRFTFPNEWRADLGVAVPLGFRAPDNSSRSARFLLSLSSALKLCPQRGLGPCI